jgi:hypothetical protein
MTRHERRTFHIEGGDGGQTPGQRAVAIGSCSGAGSVAALKHTGTVRSDRLK